jgi:hypothetical protein
MVVGGITLLVVPRLRKFAPLAFGLYGAAAVVEAVRVSRRHGLALAPIVAAIFPVLHVSHGVGFAAGLVRYALRPDWSQPHREQASTSEPPAIPPHVLAKA